MNNIPIDHVSVGPRLRPLNPETVRSLADSIMEVGLLNPIIVVPFRKSESSVFVERYRLLAGHHRLEACRLLEWKEIPANQVQMHEVDQRLVEIDENLRRAELNPLERAQHLAERKTLYELKHPDTKQGRAGGLASGKSRSFKIVEQDQSDRTNDNLSFAHESSKITGKTERDIQRDIRRVEKISPAVQETIKSIPSIAGNGMELDALANLEEPEQMAAVQAVLDGKARSIREVVRQKEEASRPPANQSPDQPEERDETNNSTSVSGDLQYWKRRAKESSDEVLAAKGNIRTLKKQTAELKARVKELETSKPTPMPPAPPVAELDEWRRRALAAEEECITLHHQMNEIKNGCTCSGSRGVALRSLLDDLETGLRVSPGDFFPTTLLEFRNRFHRLASAVEDAMRRTNQPLPQSGE